MKLKIEKTRPDGIRITLTEAERGETANQVVVDLDGHQADGLIQLLAAAQKAETFRMELES